MATPEHTPRGRGYDHSLVYYHHTNDAWTMVAWSEKQCSGMDVTDLWMDEGPAHGLNNSRSCSQTNQTPGCVYEDKLFTDRVMTAIQQQPSSSSKGSSKPFFVLW